EALFETLAHLFTRQSRNALDCGNRARLVLHDEPRQSILDHFRHRSAVEGDDRGPAGQGFNHDKAEWLWPIDGREQRDCTAENMRFLAITDLAQVFDPGSTDQRPNLLFEIVAVDVIDLGGNLERDAAPLRDPDRPIRRFFRRDAAKEGDVVS